MINMKNENNAKMKRMKTSRVTTVFLLVVLWPLCAGWSHTPIEGSADFQNKFRNSSRAHCPFIAVQPRGASGLFSQSLGFEALSSPSCRHTGMYGAPRTHAGQSFWLSSATLIIKFHGVALYTQNHVFENKPSGPVRDD